MNEIKLTQYSKASGCGCKIAPAVLEEILQSDTSATAFKELLVGNHTKDDAAVYDLGEGKALISTIDFFTPIVDDAFDFGRIAAANAISDVYAMGGKPLLATAMLGWPIDKLPAVLARKVLEGAKAVCKEANIPLAGGHSVDTQEPLFGLSVNGLVQTTHLKKNASAKAGDLLYLTKPLGSGILSAALKCGLINDVHTANLITQLTTLNKAGEQFGRLPCVHAMTDVTGFGLLGHLIEMAEGSGLTAELQYDNIRLMDGVKEYLAQRIVPDNAYRNWNAYEKKVKNIGTESFYTLCDPQTNGGLLVSIDAAQQKEFEEELHQLGLQDFVMPIGRMKAPAEVTVKIK